MRVWERDYTVYPGLRTYFWRCILTCRYFLNTYSFKLWGVPGPYCFSDAYASAGNANYAWLPDMDNWAERSWHETNFQLPIPDDWDEERVR